MVSDKNEINRQLGRLISYIRIGTPVNSQMRYLDYTQIRKTQLYRLEQTFGVIIAGLLLLFYLVPNTQLDKISPEYFANYSGLLSPNLYLTIVISIAYLILISFIFKRSESKRRWMPLWLLLLFYVTPGVLELFFWSGNPRVCENVSSILLTVLIGSISACLCRNSENALKLISVISTIQSLITIYNQRIGYNTMVSGDIHRAGGSFNDPRCVYFLMVVTLPFLIVKAFESEKTVEQLFYMLSASLQFAALVLTWDRGGIVAIFFSLIWVISKVISNKRILAASTVFLLIAVLSVSLARVSGSTNYMSSGRSVEGRVAIWKSGGEILRNHWIAGVGFGALLMPVEESHNRLPGKQIYIMENESKSIFLTLADELGIFGVLLFIFFSVNIVCTISGVHKDRTSISVGGAWIAIGIASLFDTPFSTVSRSSGNVIFGFLLVVTVFLGQKILPQGVIDEYK